MYGIVGVGRIKRVKNCLDATMAAISSRKLIRYKQRKEREDAYGSSFTNIYYSNRFL